MTKYMLVCLQMAYSCLNDAILMKEHNILISNTLALLGVALLWKIQMIYYGMIH